MRDEEVNCHVERRDTGHFVDCGPGHDLAVRHAVHDIELREVGADGGQQKGRDAGGGAAEIGLEDEFPDHRMAMADDGDAGVASWAGVIWFLIFVLFPFFNRDRLRCGDLIAGTWVVEAPKRKLEQALSVSDAARGQSQTTGAAYRFSDADLAVYGEFELQTLERVLRENREEALVDVAQTICRKIGWSAGPIPAPSRITSNSA